METEQDDSTAPSSKRVKTARSKRMIPSWLHDEDGNSTLMASQSIRAVRTATLLESLTSDTSRCSPAWSSTNLLALPLPLPPSSSTSSSSTLTQISLTHLSGCSSSPHPRFGFTLDLPISSQPSYISHLSFSPCGAYLLATSTFENGEKDDVLTVFEQTEGCLNDWSIIWHESLSRFGQSVSGQPKTLVRTRWIGEPRKWWPAPDPSTSARPFFASPARSSPVSGCAFVVVLSSSEVLFVHLNRMIPLMPLTALLPLRPAPPHSQLSLSALPTAPSFISSPYSSRPLIGASPSNAVDSIVANLVDANPNVGTITSGPDALKNELIAAQASANALSNTRKLIKSAIGSVGGGAGSSAIELGETTFIIASWSKLIQRNRRRGEEVKIKVEHNDVKIVQSYAKDSPDPDDDEFGMTDFNALDEAFGAPSTAVKVEIKADREDEDDDVERQDDEGLEGAVERMIELSEVRVEMGISDGPKISVRPLSPISLDDPLSVSAQLQGELTHLEWLEHLDRPMSSPDAEQAADLRLLTVTSSFVEDQFSSAMTSWALSEEAYPLSEAFSTLEQKKNDAVSGQKDWSSRRIASSIRVEVVSCVWTNTGSRLGSFFIGIESSESGGTSLSMIDSNTLDEIDGTASTPLARSELYTDLAFSPNGALVCALPFGPSRLYRPTISAVALGDSLDDLDALSTQLALSITRQGDNSDLVGRILGMDDEMKVLEVARETRNKLQRSLPPSINFENTAAMYELLGLYSTLYNAANGLSLRGAVVKDLVRLAVVLRAYRKCERRERAAPIDPTSYRCESDAVWPLISHASWFCDFARQLAQSCSTDSSSPKAVLLLHPTARGMISSAIDMILGLQIFLRSFPAHQNFTVDIAKTVLDDAIDYNGLIIPEFKATLIKLAEEILSTLLSNSALYLPKGLPGPAEDDQIKYDVVRRSRLGGEGAFKQCLRCGERTEKKTGNETGKWAAYELAWEGKCMCGGLWISQLKE